MAYTNQTMVAEQHGHFDEELGEPRGASSPVARALRDARHRAGYSLPDVASMLRIRLIHLQAIEDGRFGDLPGPVYAIGFIRAYGEFLDLDTDHLIDRLREEVSGTDAPQELNFPEPVPDARLPGGAIVVIALLLAILAYGGWYYMSSNEISIADLFSGDETQAVAQGGGPDGSLSASGSSGSVAPDIRANASSGVGAPAATLSAGATAEDGELPVELEAEPPLGAASAAEPGMSRSSAQAAERPSDVGFGALSQAAPVLEDEPVLPAEGATRQAEETPVSSEDQVATLLAALPVAPPQQDVVISAQAMSWVQVRDGEGRLVMTRVLQPGDTYAVPETEGLVLDTGNAGGLSITVGGRAIPAVGRSGEVMRDISLDAEDLRSRLADADG